jgi:hypothetical protein
MNGQCIDGAQQEAKWRHILENVSGYCSILCVIQKAINRDIFHNLLELVSHYDVELNHSKSKVQRARKYRKNLIGYYHVKSVVNL